MAVALAETGRGSEAAQAAAEAFISAHNFEHVIIRSGALLGLVKAFLKINRIDEARRLVDVAQQKLLTIKDPIYKSDANRRVAEAFAMLGEWNQAVAAAEYSEQQIDRLAAYTAIIRQHAITQNPALAEVLKKYIE